MQEYRDMKQQDAGFEPARPVVAAFVRPPADTCEVPLITNPLTAGVSELFNASYEVLLEMLLRYFLHGKEAEDELRTLSSTAVALMVMVIKPLGQLLTTLPIGPDLPGMTAGATFEIYRTGYILPHHQAAWIVLHERLLELAAYCGKLSAQQPAPQDLQAVEENFRRLAAALEQHVKTSETLR
jgi:hypothetical protein